MNISLASRLTSKLHANAQLRLLTVWCRFVVTCTTSAPESVSSWLGVPRVPSAAMFNFVAEVGVQSHTCLPRRR